VSELPTPTLPAYRGPCLAGLVAALAAPAGQRPAWVPEPAASAAQVLLLVLDGLGWVQLRARSDLAPTLSAMTGGPITSVVPTTTATALTSTVYGAAPADHGVVGYRVRVDGPTGEEVLNVLRWRTASGPAETFVAPESFAAGSAFGGAPVPVVSRASFLGTGFTRAHLSGSQPHPWHLPSGIAVEAAAALREGAPLVYAYYDGVDKIAHVSGFGPHYDAELAFVDRLVDELLGVLPPSGALVVTADHGQVEVGPNLVTLHPHVLEGVRLVSGEGRFRWLHAHRGAASDVLAAARSTYGGEAWVRSVDELDAAGWYGGPLGGVARSRLGEVAIVPFRPLAYLDPADPGEARLVCRHGSLTDEEMLVPLLAAGR
jgi:hypothetical protein